MDLGNQPVAATLKIQQTHISLRNYTEPFSREDHFPSAHHRPGDKHNRTKLQVSVMLTRIYWLVCIRAQSSFGPILGGLGGFGFAFGSAGGRVLSALT